MRIIYLKFNTEFGTMNQALLFEEGETRTLFGFLICVNRLPLGLETVTTICVSVVAVSGSWWCSACTGLRPGLMRSERFFLLGGIIIL